MRFNTAEELQTYMYSVGNGKNAEFSKRLIPGLTSTAGMYTKDVVALAKGIIGDGDADKVLSFTGGYDITAVQGKILVLMKAPFAVKRQYLYKLVPKFDNWALCDMSVISVKPAELDEVWAYALTLLATKKEFSVRYGIVTLLGNFVNRGDRLDEVFAALDRVEYGCYNVDMAAAWLLSVAFVKTFSGDLDGDKTLSYMRRSAALGDFVIKKALQKMRESFRVPKDIKPLLKNL